MGEDQVQLPAECYGDHLNVELLTECSRDPLQAEAGDDQVQLPQECYGDHRQNRVKIKSNSLQNTMMVIQCRG